jgi:uncharacterized lipoprotein YmbA
MCRVFIVLVTLIISACSTVPSQINYHLLDSTMTDVGNNQKRITDKKITLQKLQLAKYLQSASLPLLQQDHGVIYANQHVWAEPLQLSIQRVLVNDFNQFSTHQLLLDNMPNAANSDYQLQIQIDHFSATDNSEVVLIGTYWVSDDKTVSNGQPFFFKRQLDLDGFSYAIGQQRLLINELAKMIASDIEQ